MRPIPPAIAEFAMRRAADQAKRIAALEAALHRAADALQRAEFFEEAEAALAVLKCGSTNEPAN
ncbi:hypothetical protein B597_019660 [Stutzerimonas stutzeri KOS6]|uniref:Uncharacterized protein n=1 Tax=Stutzerimonas stutzeri KOS6 TaxID=1218352 RepID=A0A061JML7_STUST|nr:hypothetical protein B597_019660 [Stutzerimonas stutzeri KOS6]